MIQQDLVRFVVEQGTMAQPEYTFTERARCIMGRDSECAPLQSTEPDVSAIHSELDINPPEVMIRDLGSLNGTKINGELIGQREPNETPEQGRKRHYGDFFLQDGDVIELAQSVRLRVLIEVAQDAYKTKPAQKPMPLEQRQAVAREQDKAIARAREAFRQQAQAKALLVLNSDDYEVKEAIGEGGMGIVFKGIHKPTQKPVALKLIHPRLTESGEIPLRFDREATILHRLKDPHIVAVQGVYQDKDSVCLVMELCNGGDLQKWIENRGSWPTPKRAVELILAVLKALEYAHKKQIIHRDIKPTNILMHFDAEKRLYQPKLSDFGLARALDQARLTATGSAGGSPKFMPRQQMATFREVGPEADVWAMAAVLYWLLTEGQTPRDFPKGCIAHRVVLTTSARPIRERNPAVPQALADVIDTALIDTPQIRVRTAKEFRQQLEKVQASQ